MDAGVDVAAPGELVICPTNQEVAEMSNQPLVITITLTPETLEPIIRRAIANDLRMPSYANSVGGSAYQEIERQVRATFRDRDYSAMIEEVRARIEAETIEAVVRADIERQAKAALRAKRKAETNA